MKKRYAVITDIHGNIEALNAILKDIKDKNVDEDIVYRGNNTNNYTRGER